MCFLAHVPPRQEGRIAIVTTRGVGCGGREVSQCTFRARTNDATRTVKSCGPGLPVLRPSLRIATSAQATGAREPVPGESTYKPLNHRAGNAGLFGWTCGDCRLLSFLQAGHGLRPAPGIPCALCVSEGRTNRRTRTRDASRERLCISQSSLPAKAGNPVRRGLSI